MELSEHLPYVTLGLIIWNMINASILEGADVHRQRGSDQTAADAAERARLPLVWRQMILFAHNIVIFVIIAIILSETWSWADLSVIPR